MNNIDFSKFVKAKHQRELELIVAKQQIYTSSHQDDRLEQFHALSRFLDREPEDVLFTLVSKHVMALKKYVMELTDTCDDVNMSLLSELVGDIRLYMFLLEALVVERSSGEAVWETLPKT